MEYYRRAVDVMESLQSTLEGRISEASSRVPRDKLDPETVVRYSPKYTPRQNTLQKGLVYGTVTFNVCVYNLVVVQIVMKRMILHDHLTMRDLLPLQGNNRHNHMQRPCMILSQRMKESWDLKKGK